MAFVSACKEFHIEWDSWSYLELCLILALTPHAACDHAAAEGFPLVSIWDPCLFLKAADHIYTCRDPATLSQVLAKIRLERSWKALQAAQAAAPACALALLLEGYAAM